MNCELLQERFAEIVNGSRFSPAEKAHLKSCAQCQSAWDDFQFIAKGIFDLFPENTALKDQDIQNRILDKLPTKKKRNYYRIGWYSTAAALLLTTLLSIFMLKSKETAPDIYSYLDSETQTELILEGALDFEPSPSENAMIEYLLETESWENLQTLLENKI
ncbi:MAG TPA: hypothetical protein ENN84_10105 [Candidatus Marinimicrobia bacterium]|nr:hypothetical protein [Candidatus Neomarinimicrobiota bacterium]